MGKKVLIVDDSIMVRQMVSFTLKEAGFDVVDAENGQDALSKLGSHAVDLIVTDLNMPLMDGITFIGRERALATTKYVPILMLTTESQPEMKIERQGRGRDSMDRKAVRSAEASCGHRQGVAVSAVP